MIYGAHFTYNNGKYIDAYFGVNSDNVIEYAKEVARGLDTKLFKYLAHPDLFMYRYINDKGELRMFDDNAYKASQIIIDACARNDIIMEMNVGGIGKGANKLADGRYEYGYPRTEFWSLVSKNKNIKVAIGRDAHDPNALISDNLEKIIKMANDLGIKIINM